MKVIPLVGGSVNAHQTMNVQLGDYIVGMRLNYIQSGQWVVDLSIDDTVIAAGLMLEPGADIIASHSTLRYLGKLVFVGKETTLDNLGKENNLVWVPPE